MSMASFEHWQLLHTPALKMLSVGRREDSVSIPKIYSALPRSADFFEHEMFLEEVVIKAVK